MILIINFKKIKKYIILIYFQIKIFYKIISRRILNLKYDKKKKERFMAAQREFYYYKEFIETIEFGNNSTKVQLSLVISQYSTTT